ncbi:MAG TPA: dynamin family protein, partial [Vicinamibacterales bacterium]
AAGVALRAELARTIGRAFDITDIARLRDRPRLHGIVDATVAAAMERFAGDVATLITAALSGTAQTVSATLATDPLPLAADAARAFDADPASGAWSIDLATGVRSTIVISALGGPAVTFVAAIASRFAAAPFGTYMKRELIADMDSDLAPAFEREIERFVDDIGERLERIAGFLAERVGGLALRARTDALGALDRAAAAQAGGDRTAAAAALHARSAAAGEAAERIAARAAAFAAELALTPPRAATAVVAEPALPTAGDDRRFDPETYEHGLHPERWRVAVIGAWKRGKSSLINALAERPVLADADDAAFRFPVHVRYGSEPHAYALTDDAVWDEIPADAVLAAAARTPVLVLVPWSLPRELVLVHAPAFDAGVPAAEEIVFAAAGAASEVLALFSRQLSDVELDLYGRLARLGKPLTFVHTIADHETSNERRRVVNLAAEYLRERAIPTPRIFTVSTRERAGWNELGALRGTLAAHAEEHMERLRRVQRERAEQARLASSVAQGPPRKPTLLERILGDLR